MSSDEVPLALWPPVEGRSCGTCSMCCGPAMLIKVVEKPFGAWCRHCQPGNGGCGIYDSRPEVCRKFACAWVAGTLPDELHPLKVNAVIADYHAEPGEDEIVIWIDPNDPTAHERDPLKSWIERAAMFARVKLVCGERSFIGAIT